ncbi:histone H3-like centromeric protein A isoform X2 [Corvus kubaryi]|uniref:histone H3-like centromeric protein A isoform X2 n=1 Tax=Corvus kubaryi TaxID=68294 RepID=UPI001C05D1B5|nr:histone H3-like centromeric protein A isoform X2 [Corvus kubaryi]
MTPPGPCRGPCPGGHVIPPGVTGQSGGTSASPCARGRLQRRPAPRSPCGGSPAGGRPAPAGPSGQRGAALWVLGRGRCTHSHVTPARPCRQSAAAAGHLCTRGRHPVGSESPMSLCGRSHVGDHLTASRLCGVRHLCGHVTPRMPCGPQGRRFPSPCAGGGPGLRSREPREAPQPIRSSARDALQGAPLQQPLGPSRPSWNPHQGAPNPWAAGESLLWHLQHHLTWGSARGGETTAVKGTWHQRRHQQSKKHFPSSSWCQVNSDGRSDGFCGYLQPSTDPHWPQGGTGSYWDYAGSNWKILEPWWGYWDHYWGNQDHTGDNWNHAGA